MNLFKATLDTRYENCVIGPITQFDNATLELQILSGGQVGEAWNSPEFELIAMKRDMNPVREVDQDKFIILSKEDHRVQIELKEQFLTCRGTVKMQLVVQDGGRTSTTIFYLSVGQSLDHTIVESLKDIKVLDDLDEVVESLGVLEVTASANEEKRQENEKLREVAESNRQDEFEQAQNQRDVEFNEKMEEYQDYVSANEEKRQENEKLRELAESNRQDEFSKAQSQRDTEFNNKMEEFQEHVNGLEGEKGEQGETPQIRVNETHIQVKYPSEQEWFDLIALEMLRGRQGLQGLQGEALQIQTNETHIQFKYPSQQKWTDLVALESLRGLQGIQGEQGYSGVFIGKPEDAPASANLVIDDDMTDYELLIADANRDYMGNDHQTLRQAANANVDYAIRTAVGEFNYLAYEGQMIKATNTIEGHAKSAFLKGQTLVNLINFDVNNISKGVTIDRKTGVITNTATGTWSNCFIGSKYTPKPSTKYLVVFNILENTLTAPADLISTYKLGTTENSYFIKQEIANAGQTGVLKFICQTKDSYDERCKYISRAFLGAAHTIGHIKYTVMCFEYQDGMENWDIPYFEGMQSTKSPVLTTAGKNYIDAEKMQLGFLSDGDKINPHDFWVYTPQHLKIKSGTYYIKSDIFNSKKRIGLYDKNKSFIKVIEVPISNTTLVIPSGVEYIRISCSKYPEVAPTQEEIDTPKIIVSDTATTYEPYKSNILLTPEEVILRSLPNGVCDTLNLITGEYIQRIGEIVLDGSEGWRIGGLVTNPTFIRFDFDAGLIPGRKPLNCDKFPYLHIHQLPGGNSTVNQECITNHSVNDSLNLVIKKDRLTSLDLVGFRSWLKANPITIQYELATPSVKQVKLSQNEVYSYNGVTTYNCRSGVEESLIPTLTVTVPTNIQEVIQAERQKNIELSEAQDVLIEYQLQMYENTTPVALCTREMPIFVRNLYELAYERGIRMREEVEADVDVH